MNVEVMRNTLYKAYLDDFAAYCASLGGATAEIMGDLLAFEADRRALNITLNSIGTELTRDDRRRLYSRWGDVFSSSFFFFFSRRRPSPPPPPHSLGLLHPHGHLELAGADDFDAVRAAMERCPPYRAIISRLGGGEPQALDRVLFEEEARWGREGGCGEGRGEPTRSARTTSPPSPLVLRRCGLAFEVQFHYATFWAYLRLREQEARNLLWVAECIAQDVKGRAPDGVINLYG
jgi:V-type H+-transporting ATPase subunit d